jgi:Fibronectin type III domain
MRVFAPLFALALVNLLPWTANGQTFVQMNSGVPSSGVTVGVNFAKAQVAGDLNVVIVGWNDTTATVKSVGDTMGNVYTLAVGPSAVPGALSQSIYYAKNIVAAGAGANTVTVTFSTSATYPDIRILEYSGLDSNSPFDGATGSTGSAATTDSGALATTNPNDLLLGANIVSTSTAAAGSGFTLRVITSPDGDLAEDQLVTATGSYHATSSLTSAGPWIMQMVAFKAAGAAPAPSAPANLSTAVISSSQINLSWSASTESGGTIANYLVERCQGAGCTAFAQIASSTTTTFNDTSLAPSTPYVYRVRAKDTTNNTGPYSNTATATTQSSTIPTPTAPSNLTATAGASGPLVVAAQGYINSTSLVTHTTAAFDSTGGDVIVLCASSHAGVTMTPSDSFGNSWITIAGPTSTTAGNDLRTQLWYARNPTVGSGHTVTMTMSIAQPLVISVIVVHESNIAAPIDAVSTIGSDGGTQTTNVTSPNITTASSYDLLIGFAKSAFGADWFAGTGFTAQPNASSSFLFTETGLAVTPGVYDATFGIGGNLTWQAAVVAVSPSVAATSTNQVSLSWTAATETGGTIANYLVERCQGAGCTNFAQIGSAANTTYTDTAVSPSTTYVYRVRAIDTSNTTGPYSNTASASL